MNPMGVTEFAFLLCKTHTCVYHFIFTYLIIFLTSLVIRQKKIYRLFYRLAGSILPVLVIYLFVVFNFKSKQSIFKRWLAFLLVLEVIGPGAFYLAL